MISRELVRLEVDKVRAEYLDLLYRIIQILENGATDQMASIQADVGADELSGDRDWHKFVASTYGCLSEAPISRGEQGRHENREAME